MENKNQPYFYCFSQKLMSYLTGLGFVLQGMRKDRKETNRNIYFFNNSEELQTAIKLYRR